MIRRKSSKHNKTHGRHNHKRPGEHHGPAHGDPFGKLPPYLEECLEIYKIKKEEIKLSLMLDVTMDFNFGESWLLATEKELCVISGTNLMQSGFREIMIFMNTANTRTCVVKIYQHQVFLC